MTLGDALANLRIRPVVGGHNLGTLFRLAPLGGMERGSGSDLDPRLINLGAVEVADLGGGEGLAERCHALLPLRFADQR